MDIRQLQQLGAFSVRSLVPKKIKVSYPVPLPAEQWADPAVPEYPEKPETKSGVLDTFIRRRSASDWLELATKPQREQGCFLILRCVCDKDGNPTFPDYDTVNRLEDWLFIPLLLAVSEVNNAGPKPSPPMTSSGVTSPSPSGGAPLPNGKKSSRQTSGDSGASTPKNTDA